MTALKTFISLLLLSFFMASCTQGPNLPKQALETVKLLGRTPHVPFAYIKTDSILPVNKSDSQLWSDTSQIWYNLNSQGAIVGTSKIIGSHFYDVTQCREYELQTIDGVDGTGLYTSKKINWEMDSSWFWEPTGQELNSLMNFKASLSSLVLDSQRINSQPDQIKEMTVFFKVSPIDENNIECSLRTKCVVLGCEYFFIAYLTGSGEWKLAHLENTYSNSEYCKYEPIAVVDIGKNGLPEIIFQHSLGHAFWDRIIRLDNIQTMESWKIEASSVGGALL